MFGSLDEEGGVEVLVVGICFRCWVIWELYIFLGESEVVGGVFYSLG